MSEDTNDTDNGMGKLRSRFGPVPERDPSRPAPGPRRADESVQRPTPGPQRIRSGGAPGLSSPRPAETVSNPDVSTRDSSMADVSTAVAVRPTPAPLFDEPADDVFGTPQPSEWATIDAEPLPMNAADEPPVEVIDRRDWVRVPRRTGPVFRFFVVALVLGLGASTVYSRVTGWFDDQYDPPGEPGDAVEFVIPSGATANDVTQSLYANNVITNPTLFRYWLGDNFEGDFLAGDYACLQENMSFDEALDCLDGVGPLPPQFFSITIPEGLRVDEIIEVLNRENPGFSEAALEEDLKATLVSVGLTGVPEEPIPGSPDPTGSGKEGLLFPATYQIDEKKSEDTLDILRRMADTMELKFTQIVDSEGKASIIDELELTDYEVIIIASLIEEEYLIDEDLGRISRVIYNRLANGRFSLGIDATSCYAAQKPCADLNVEDLNSESPWNTRNLSNFGLPPTPISSPGEKALRAALNPELGDWLYYVRTEEDGGHTFAVTDAEFNAAKAVCIERGYC